MQRIDLEGRPVIDCLADKVVETTRGTVIAEGEIKISTIEQAMSALYASGIDNCRIELDGPEMPILDGSSLVFIQNIQRVGLKEQDAEKQFKTIDKDIVIDGPKGEHIVISPADKLSLDITIAFESKMLASQSATLDDIADFATEVASARTFVFVRDIQPLFELGYIKGGDLDNAIVIYENQQSQERLDKLADEMGVPHIDATKLGYLNRRPLT
ncbi:MAG: UDP-3-O-acyl-N-acetylglucosamine deacetylase [Bacteroidaceae bacterium]|nr:UDP-3-O-acyl-N-acetylglucosamine deacetylase [Bacteroidaceae bacterium]